MPGYDKSRLLLELDLESMSQSSAFIENKTICLGLVYKEDEKCKLVVEQVSQAPVTDLPRLCAWQSSQLETFNCFETKYSFET